MLLTLMTSLSRGFIPMFIHEVRYTHTCFGVTAHFGFLCLCTYCSMTIMRILGAQKHSETIQINGT